MGQPFYGNHLQCLFVLKPHHLLQYYCPNLMAAYLRERVFLLVLLFLCQLFYNFAPKKVFFVKIWQKKERILEASWA